MRLVYLALGWCVGILLAANVALHIPLLWLALTASALMVLLRTRRLEAGIILLVTLGGLRMALTPTTSGIAAYNDLGGMTIEGVVASEPDRRDDRVQLRVAVETVTRAGATLSTDGLVLVNAPPLTGARYGDRIQATGLLFEPGESDRFSYADYLARSGVYSIMQDAAVAVLEPAKRYTLLGSLIALREHIADAIRAHLPEPQAGLLVGILLGNERGIAPEVSDAFAATGAAHVIAISGFNMAVLSGVISETLRRFRLRPLSVALISVAVIGTYTVLVGANPAVVRAALMSGLLVVGRGLRRDAYLPASLGFAALALSLANPLVLWDVSFQLSFFATLGLALFAEPLQKRFRLKPENPPSTMNSYSPILKLLNKAVIFLIEPLTVTLAALVFTLPLTMLYFGQVSPVILLVNLLIVPFQPALLLVGGAAALLTGVFEPLAQVLFWLTMLPLSWTIEIVRIFGRIPTIEVFISGNLVAAFFIVLVGAALIRASRPRWSVGVIGWLRRRTVVSATGVSAVGIIVLIGALALSRPDGRLHIWLLEMGGSNAVLIQTPRGAQMLIDGGRFPSRLLTALGDRMPFTDRTLEVVFLTQPDEMQFGALRPVLERYTPGVIISNGQPNLGAAWTALQTQVNAYPQVTALAGYTVETSDSVKIEALNPQHTPALGTPLDEAVLVLRLTYGEASFLLVSDLNREGQQALVDSGYDLRSTVLQIPSRVDAAFLDVVQAPVLVTQVEEANPDELAKLGEVSIYRTDTGGTIHLSTDGKELWISQTGR